MIGKNLPVVEDHPFAVVFTGEIQKSTLRQRGAGRQGPPRNASSKSSVPKDKKSTPKKRSFKR